MNINSSFFFILLIMLMSCGNPVSNKTEATTTPAEAPKQAEQVEPKEEAKKPTSLSNNTRKENNSSSNQMAEAMELAINKLRKSGCTCGNKKMPPVPALSWNRKLSKAARVHANDMRKNNFFSHTGSNGSKMSDRISQAGYNWSRAGENVANGQTSLAQVMDSWTTSPGHCENMMSPDFTEFGTARAGNYWVQTFGRPR